MEPPFKRARIGAGDPENFEENSTESEESEGVQVSGGGGDDDKLMLSENTNSHPAPVELEELTRNESCLLGDLKGSPDDLNVGESKKEEVSEIRNSWLTEYAEIALKEKENENKTLKKEYKAFVDEYAKASNQILKVMAKQKKEIADLKLKNGNQKMQIDLFEKGKEVKVETKVEATDEKEGIVKCESLERKPFAVSFRKVGGEKEVLMSRDKEEIISLFNAELRDIEEGMNYLNDVIRGKESEIEKKNKVLDEETEQRVQLEAQAVEAKEAFKEALEAQMDEIERIKKESDAASPKVDVFKRKLEAKKVLINQLTLELGSAQAALLAKDSVEVKEAFEKVLEEKEIELEQMRNELKKKLNNVSHKENFFKEALEAKSVVISQLTLRSEDGKAENEDLRRENAEVKNKNLRQQEEMEKLLNERDEMVEERRLGKEEEKSQKMFVLKLQSENIEQESRIALLRHQTRSLRQLNEELETGQNIQNKKVSELGEKLERERVQTNSTQDVIFELEACNKKQDEQIDKLEKNISELKLRLENAKEGAKSEKEEVDKQKEVLKERNVSLKMKLIAQNNLQKEEKKSTEQSFNKTISEMKKKHKDEINHLKMSMLKDKTPEKEPNFQIDKEMNLMENGTEPSQSKVKAFITQIESTEKVSEIDNLFVAMFTSSSAEDAAPVAGSSTNFTTRDLAFFSSEDEDDGDKNLSRKSNSSQPTSPKQQREVSVVHLAEPLEEGEVSNKVPGGGSCPQPQPPPQPAGGRCPLCRQNFPTIDKLEVHASGCMQENSFSLKSCFVLLKNIKCGENKANSQEKISPSKKPKHTIPYLVPGPKIFTVI